jgi:hypothetical protein
LFLFFLYFLFLLRFIIIIITTCSILSRAFAQVSLLLSSTKMSASSLCFSSLHRSISLSLHCVAFTAAAAAAAAAFSASF